MKKLLVLMMVVVMGLSCVACGDNTSSTSEAESVEQIEATENINEKTFEEVVLVDNENLTFIVKDAILDETWGTWDLKVFIENKTDMPLMYSWDDVSVNGYMIDPFWGTSVEPGKKENTSISFYLTTFEENNIETVEEIILTLSVYNDDTWEDILKEEFKLNFN